MEIKRGMLYMADLGSRFGSIQSGMRPVVVISNNMNNKFSPTVNVLPITSKTKNNIPVHVNVGKKEGLDKESTVLAEQVTTINKSQIKEYIGKCSSYKISEIEKAIMIQNGMNMPSLRPLAI